MLEKFYQNKELLLNKSLQFFFESQNQKNSNSLIPKFGIELEFFLLEEDKKTPAATDNFISKLSEKFADDELVLFIEKEQGASQVEVKTNFVSDLEKLCQTVESIKKYAVEIAQQLGFVVSFAGVPIDGDCSNSMQINISLHDVFEQNEFENEESDYLLSNAVQNLLHHTNDMMIFLAPNSDDYHRFSEERNLKLFKNGKNIAPINLSFGADNRSCAIRVPSLKAPFICPQEGHEHKSNYGRRIEYRVPAANVDLHLLLAAILLVLSSDEEYSKEFEQIYGNAFDKQYDLESLCSSIEEAKDNFRKDDNFVRKIFESFLESN